MPHSRLIRTTITAAAAIVSTIVDAAGNWSAASNADVVTGYAC